MGVRVIATSPNLIPELSQVTCVRLSAGLRQQVGFARQTPLCTAPGALPELLWFEENLRAPRTWLQFCEPQGQSGLRLGGRAQGSERGGLSTAHVGIRKQVPAGGQVTHGEDWSVAVRWLEAARKGRPGGSAVCFHHPVKGRS